MLPRSPSPRTRVDVSITNVPGEQVTREIQTPEILMITVETSW